MANLRRSDSTARSARPAKRSATGGRSKKAVRPSSAAAVLDRFAPAGDSIGFVVREVYRGFARSLHARIASEGVSIGMWYVLRTLWEQDGLTQRELSEKIGINGPTMFAAINSMEKAGVVRRVPNQDDRRKTNIFLTARGHKLKKKLWPMAQDVYAVALRGISRKEIASGGEFLRRVWANLEAERASQSIAAVPE